ncbi:hypothetical protein D3C81_1997860 [compost metagenome]
MHDQSLESEGQAIELRSELPLIGSYLVAAHPDAFSDVCLPVQAGRIVREHYSGPDQQSLSVLLISSHELMQQTVIGEVDHRETDPSQGQEYVGHHGSALAFDDMLSLVQQQK